MRGCNHQHWLALLVAFNAMACGEEANNAPAMPSGDVFIAVHSDLSRFRDWRRMELGSGEHADSDGEKVLYINRALDAITASVPLGTIVVKTVEIAESSQWTIHAMAKRGGGFNAAGAVGWEFFELSMIDERTAGIVWRGEEPPSGGAYGSGDATPDQNCNECHHGSDDRSTLLSGIVASQN